QFKMLNEKTGIEYALNQEIVFKGNNTIGSIETPYLLKSSTHVPCESNVNVNTEDLLASIFPIPFEDEIHVSFTLNDADQVTIKLFDLTGKEVIQLANGKYEQGEHKINSRLGNLSSGVYIMEIKTASKTLQQKIMKF
nr:T9SS type A sorting domain-containing protein [Bacteroidia bacterium]